MTSDAGPGAALQSFVQAAGAGDVDALWGLLSRTTRERLGPTRDEFEEEYAEGFRNGVGTFAGAPVEMVVTGSDESGWGVAAIAGERTRAGVKEFAAYGAALRLEDGEWRLELGAPITVRQLTGTSPGVVEVEIDADATVVAAGLWLDGEPLSAVVVGDDPEQFVVHAERVNLGSERRVGVVFARTDESASAGAFPLNAAAEQAG